MAGYPLSQEVLRKSVRCKSDLVPSLVFNNGYVTTLNGYHNLKEPKMASQKPRARFEPTLHLKRMMEKMDVQAIKELTIAQIPDAKKFGINKFHMGKVRKQVLQEKGVESVNGNGDLAINRASLKIVKNAAKAVGGLDKLKATIDFIEEAKGM